MEYLHEKEDIRKELIKYQKLLQWAELDVIKESEQHYKSILETIKINTEWKPLRNWKYYELQNLNIVYYQCLNYLEKRKFTNE